MSDLAPTIIALKAAAVTQQRLCVAQLGQSLDGRIATRSGHSHYINGPAAIAVLHALRANVDAVVIGAGTALADNPRLTVRQCEGRDPVRVLIDRRRTAGSALNMLADDGCRRIVFGLPLAGDPDGVEIVYAPPGPTALQPAAVLDALAVRGLRRILIEGGAATVSAFLAAGALDRLCLLVAPLVIGSGPVGLNLPPIDRLDAAIRPATTMLPLPGGDVLFDCGLR